jgi:hypothetical protein
MSDIKSPLQKFEAGFFVFATMKKITLLLLASPAFLWWRLFYRGR